MTAKTVKVSTNNQNRRVELYDVDPDGRRNPAIICRADEFPHPRSGIANRWIPGPICGPTDNPMRWWTAA